MNPNLNFDAAKVLAFLQGIAKDLRSNRLWPLAIVLLVAIVAVPLALSKSSSAPLSAPVAAAPAPSAATAVPALSVQTTPAHSRLSGRGHDPFAPEGGGGSSTTTSAATGTTVAGQTSATGQASTTPGGGGSSSGKSTTSAAPTIPVGNPLTIVRATKPGPVTTALSADQSYRVAVAVTDAAGGLDTIHSLERLSVLPSKRAPLLVELGVLKGGHRVLFAVTPGAIIGGPGTCTPGPIDCEILSLGQNQIEAISTRSATGVVPVAMFAVTAIKAGKFSSPSAANKARRQESQAGRDVLNSLTLSALPLFKYESSVGAVVNLRNLAVGGT